MTSTIGQPCAPKVMTKDLDHGSFQVNILIIYDCLRVVKHKRTIIGITVAYYRHKCYNSNTEPCRQLYKKLRTD